MWGDDPGVGVGRYVAVSGNTAVVTGGTSAVVFAITATGWRQAAELEGPVKDGAFNADTVSISGGRALVGDPYDGSGRADIFAA
ncbi:MAG: hypothetical protein ACLPUG_03170 [Acidimicrobiales bacterium]